MPHIVDVNTMLEGPRHVILHVYMKSDGVSPELTDYVLIDPASDLGLAAGPVLTIEEVLFSFAGFDASIEFDNGLVEDSMIWVLPEGNDRPVDFVRYGGFKDQGGPDATGKLQITTTGFRDAGDQGSLIIKIRK